MILIPIHDRETHAIYSNASPSDQGIRAMLPHVDEFRAVHSLDAVADLCRALSGARGFTREVDPRRWLHAATARQAG